jgi:hypothetical protein
LPTKEILAVTLWYAYTVIFPFLSFLILNFNLISENWEQIIDSLDNRLWYPFYLEAGWATEPIWNAVEKKKIVPLVGIEARLSSQSLYHLSITMIK